MNKQVQIKNEELCLKVPKVFDLVTRESKFQVCLNLGKPFEVKDEICGNFMLECSSNINRLWHTDIVNVSGTISIFLDQGCSKSVDIFVNGSFAFSVGEGETRSRTVESLQSLEVRCGNGTGFCIGKYCLNIHYQFKEICIPNQKSIIECHLKEIECIEVPQENGRRKETISTLNGDIVTLQEVILLKKGCISIEFKENGKLCRQVIPFEFIETVLLCAPNGTRIECEIANFRCFPIVQTQGNCTCIEIFVTICQSIESIADVVITFDGTICSPREDLNLTCE